MRIVLNIPSEFVQHYKLDKFNDSMMRVIQELKDIPFKHKWLVGEYEMETLDMLRISLMQSRMLEGKLNMGTVYGKAALEAGKEEDEKQ